MAREPLSPGAAQNLLAADRVRPAPWRWMAFWTLVLVVVSLWFPPILLVPPAEGGAPTPFTLPQFALLGAVVLLAVLAAPTPSRIRLLIAACLVGTTLLAWALEAPIRTLLGGQFAVPGS